MASPLVSTEWLIKHLDDENLRIIDIRGHVRPASEPHPHYFSHREDYDKSHIQGALFVDWTSDIVEPDSISSDIADPEMFAELMGKLGIGEGTKVVAYDDANGMFAARMWWALRYYGHEDVFVLDGGWQKWLSEGHPVTADIPDVAPTTFIPKIVHQLRKTADDILANITQKDLQLIDVRSIGEFDGKSSRAKRFGHIPNAINVPRSDLLAEDGTMLASDKLVQVFTDAGINLNTDEEIVTYCNGGVSASYGILALNVAGFQQTSVYDGSWKDWGNDESKPIVS